MQPNSVPAPGAAGIFADLADLAARDSPALPNGFCGYVIAEREVYQLDTQNPLTTSSPLVVARGGTAGTGKWYRRSRAYVVGNFTLWAQSYGFGLVGFSPGQLTASSSAAPEIVLDLRSYVPVSSNQQGVTIDSLGNPWVTFNSFNLGFVTQKLLLKDCLISGAPMPSVVITPPASIPTEAGHTLFDRLGNLWIANGTHSTFGVSSWGCYGQNSYGLTGSPVPTCTTAIFNPGSLFPSSSNQQHAVFDGFGNLWSSLGFTGIANGGIIKVAAEQLRSDLNVLPATFWTGSNFGSAGLGGTVALAFAPSGLLWCSQYGNGGGTLIRAWDPAQPSGNPAPVVTISCATFNGPYGIAFDSSGNLWVSNGNNNTLMRLPAASLTASGTVVPDVILTPVTTTLTSHISFPTSPDRSGLLPSGVP